MDQHHKLVVTALQSARLSQPIALVDGSATRDYIYVDDIAEAFCRMTLLEDKTAHEINLGSGVSTSAEEIVTRLEFILNAAIPRTQERRPWSIYDRGDIRADISKAGALLNWRPETDMDDGLRRTVHWYRKVYNWY